jgi:hypothetical protein
MAWSDAVSFPYRLRERIMSRFGEMKVDPMAPSPGYLTRLIVNGISFAPPLAALVSFMLYVVCALYELARTWRSVVQIVQDY